MARIAAMPFRTASQDAVKMAAWRLVEPSGEETSLKDEIKGWDYSLDICLRSEFLIDIERVYSECSLGGDARLSLVVSWHSTASQVRGLGCRHDFGEGGQSELDVNLKVPGEDLAASVDVVSTIVLLEPSGKPEILAARLSGSRLWESRTRFYLEGSGSRFPMQVVDFERLGIPSSGWKLTWSPTNLDVPYQHGLVLNINEKNERLMEALKDENDVLHSILMFDVGRQLVTSALMSQEFIEQYQSYEDGSVGKAILGLISVCFPDRSVSDLASYYRQEPAEIEGQLQHSLKILGD